MDGLEKYAREALIPAFLAFAEVAGSVLLLLALGALLHVLTVLLFRRGERYAALLPLHSADRAKQVATLIGLAKNFVLAVGWVVIGVTAVGEMGLDVTPILAGAGFLGLALGFGAQNVVRDLLGGIFHIAENQIRVGDLVRINGVEGVVEEITYRIVVVRDFAHAVHVFPHGQMQSLTNLTKGHSGVVIDVPVPYDEDLDRMIALIRRVGTSLSEDVTWRRSILEPMEVLGVEDFADSAMLIRVRFKTAAAQQWSVGREFRRRMKSAFDMEDIDISPPHHRFHADPGRFLRGLKERREEEDFADARDAGGT
jgi:small conductance mechanosensitive channel